jgi:hypothetical protein
MCEERRGVEGGDGIGGQFHSPQRSTALRKRRPPDAVKCIKTHPRWKPPLPEKTLVADRLQHPNSTCLASAARRRVCSNYGTNHPRQGGCKSAPDPTVPTACAVQIADPIGRGAPPSIVIIDPPAQARMHLQAPVLTPRSDDFRRGGSIGAEEAAIGRLEAASFVKHQMMHICSVGDCYRCVRESGVDPVWSGIVN